MDLRLVVGPPGSGKTHRMLRTARERAGRGDRVWWVGLPAQRAHVLRLATREGPLLGFEFLTPQQLAYRVLADARRLRPLLTGTGRLALVGEALLADRDDPPTPGEARLFAGAIAEAKRHGLTAADVPGGDAETERLRRVFAGYERLKGEAWDYDDFRLGATAFLESSGPGERRSPGLEPDLVVLDGLREVSPLDFRFLRALARQVPVRMALAVAPPGRPPDEVLPARDGVVVHAHAFANPVAEARWVLRDVKAVLAAGADPLDLALIVPRGRSRAVAALADEYGLPLMDETPRGLADRPEGRRLLDLLELPEHPTATRLLALPELHGLGVAALDAGVAGRDAVLALARARGEEETWRRWLERLEVPAGDPMAWAEAVVDHALAAVRDDAGTAEDAGDDEEAEEARREEARFREHALQRVAEARRVASGPHVRPWWAALLQETTTFARPAAGVALLHPVQAGGRRFRRAWLVGAADGAYGSAEREDYFVPEDLRASWADAFARAGLPRRFLGRGGDEFAELRARGDVTVVTVAEGDRGGRVAAEAALVGPAPTPAPVRPAGSRLELPGVVPYRPPDGPVALGDAEVESLGRFARCGFRYWAEERLRRSDEEAPPWADLRRALVRRRRWRTSDLRELAEDHAWAGEWLARHEEALASFTFGVDLREGAREDAGEGGVWARLDAARRADGEAVLVRFAAPGSAADEADAGRILDARSREYWAAAHLFERHRRRIGRVHLWVWPLLGDPVPCPAGGVAASWWPMKRVKRDLDRALPAWRAGRIGARPGWACRDCGVFDVCREGRR